MEHVRRVKYVLVIIQVAVISGVFLFFFGGLAMWLFVASEVSIPEIFDYILLAMTWESVSILTFLEGLLWVLFKHRVK